MTKQVIEEISSPKGTLRAKLLRRDDGLIEVEIERLVPGDGLYEPAYWSRRGHRVILADTVERAREIANEELTNGG